MEWPDVGRKKNFEIWLQFECNNYPSITQWNSRLSSYYPWTDCNSLPKQFFLTKNANDDEFRDRDTSTRSPKYDDYIAKKKRTIYLISKLVCMLFVDIIEKFSQLKLILGIFACLVGMSSMANDYRRNDLG